MFGNTALRRREQGMTEREKRGGGVIFSIHDPQTIAETYSWEARRWFIDTAHSSHTETVSVLLM